MDETRLLYKVEKKLRKKRLLPPRIKKLHVVWSVSSVISRGLSSIFMILCAPFPLTICLYPLYSDKNSLNKTVFVKQSAWAYINFSKNSANYFTNYWYVHIGGPEDRLPDSTCQHNKTALPLPYCKELRFSFLKYEFCKCSDTIMNNF